MRKYIDADELKKVFRETEDAEYARWTLAGVIGEIDDIEAADVAEVRHGRWVEFSPLRNMFSCSLCGQWGDRLWNYCPHCGSRMDLDGDTE